MPSTLAPRKLAHRQCSASLRSWAGETRDWSGCRGHVGGQDVVGVAVQVGALSCHTPRHVAVLRRRHHHPHRRVARLISSSSTPGFPQPKAMNGPQQEALPPGANAIATLNALTRRDQSYPGPSKCPRVWGAHGDFVTGDKKSDKDGRDDIYPAMR